MRSAIVAAILLGCLLFLTGGQAQKRYIVPSSVTHDLFFPAVGLGGGGNKKDLNGDDVKDQWDEKELVEGFGIANAVLSHLKQKNQGKELTAADYQQIRILIVGGYGGNTLGTLNAAINLAELGIKCDLFIIEQEKMAIHTTAELHSKPLIHLLQSYPLLFPNIKFVHLVDTEKTLESHFPDIETLKNSLEGEENEDKEETLEQIKVLLNSDAFKKHWKFNIDDVKDYTLVMDAICGASAKDGHLKLGTCKALDVLKEAEKQRVFGMAVDFPSMWDNYHPAIPSVYELLGYTPLMPNGIIHIGPLKPFVLEEVCKKMSHFAILPVQLKDALDKLVEKYQRDHAANSQILAIDAGKVGSKTVPTTQYITVNISKEKVKEVLKRFTLFHNYFQVPNIPNSMIDFVAVAA